MSEHTGWSCDTEGFINLHDDIETAVVEYATDVPDITPDTLVSVIFWEPVVITHKVCGSPLDDLLERLDDEFLPDGFIPEHPTPAMRAAEEAFISAVLADYDPRALTRVEEAVVRVGDYYRA